MTEAEKIVEEWMAAHWSNYGYGDLPELVVELIQQVAERTREECLKETIKATIGKLSDVKVVLASVIRDAKWEDENALES